MHVCMYYYTIYVSVTFKWSFSSLIFFLLIRVYIRTLGMGGTPTLSNSSVVLSRTVQPENVDFGLNLRFVSP